MRWLMVLVMVVGCGHEPRQKPVDGETPACNPNDDGAWACVDIGQCEMDAVERGREIQETDRDYLNETVACPDTDIYLYEIVHFETEDCIWEFGAVEVTAPQKAAVCP